MDPAAIAAAVFEEMDLDGSGTLEREEVDLAARKLGQALSVDELDAGFAAMDADGSGGVDFEEFYKWFEGVQDMDAGERTGWAQVAALRAEYYFAAIKGDADAANHLADAMDAADAREQRITRRHKTHERNQKLLQGGPQARREYFRSTHSAVATGSPVLDIKALSPDAGFSYGQPSVAEPRYGRLAAGRRPRARPGHCGHSSFSHASSFQGTPTVGGGTLNAVSAAGSEGDVLQAEAMEEAVAAVPAAQRLRELMQRMPSGGRLPPATVPRPQGWRAGADTSGASATAAAHGRTESVLLLAAERSAGAVREYSSPMGGRHAMLAEQAEMLANSGDITATRRRGETLRHILRKPACTQLPLEH